MPEEFERVQPGDLITAELMNRILTLLEGLDERVTELEGGPATGGPTITRLVPPGPYRVNDTVTVEGSNFQFTSGLARLFLDGTRIDLDDVSSDTRLLFLVPALPGLEESGTELQLRVVTSQGEASVPVTVRPAPPVLFGQVDVEWLGVAPETPQPDQPVTFEFRITSRASQAAEFTLQPAIAVAVNQTLWNSRLQILNADQTPMASPRVNLQPLQSRIFFARITSVPSGSTGTPFTLSVTASAGTVTRTLGPLPFEVGEEVEPPDPAINLNPTGSEPPAALVGNTVTALPSQLVSVEFFAGFTAAGDYAVSLTMLGSTDLWSITRGATTPAVITIPEGEVAAGTATRTLSVRVQPLAGATATGQVEVRLQRSAQPGGRSFVLNLIRA
jgi:hypothetical protein